MTTDYTNYRIYALVKRMGGMYRDIQKLVVYRITANKTMRYDGDVISCVANKYQHALVAQTTKNTGYIRGRPTYADVIAKLQSGELK